MKASSSRKRKTRQPRKAYTRAPAPSTARDLGWDGRRNVTMRELCLMAGVGYDQLRKDRLVHGLLGDPLPKVKGVRQRQWHATPAKHYLRLKNPAALNF